MNNRYANRNAGFSLIEVLVYLAVTVIVTSAFVTAYLTLDTTILRNTTERDMAHAASVALERMVRDIRDASSIDSATSTLLTSPGILQVTSSGTTTRFYMANGRVYVRVNNVELGPLTSDSCAILRSVIIQIHNLKWSVWR
jgi:Tfp pilus assembly protein PilV